MTPERPEVCSSFENLIHGYKPYERKRKLHRRNQKYHDNKIAQPMTGDSTQAKGVTASPSTFTIDSHFSGNAPILLRDSPEGSVAAVLDVTK
jgi:hypothetical protein